MKQNRTTRRLAETVREKISIILLYEISDPRIDFVTVTGCEVSIDRAYCTVYVSCDPDRYDEVLEGFDSAKGRIRSLLGQSLDWRVTPELTFKIDPSTDEAERIQRALEEVPPSLLKKREQAQANNEDEDKD